MLLKLRPSVQQMRNIGDRLACQQTSAQQEPYQTSNFDTGLGNRSLFDVTDSLKKPTGTGSDVEYMARAWAELMRRLGYTRYGARAETGVHLLSTRWGSRRLRDCSLSTPTCRAPF